MIDLLLATPPLTAEERYGSLAGAGSSAPSLGILMLAAVAREAGYTCSVLDAAASALTLTEVLAAVREKRPRLLGISATTLGIGAADELARRARELLPDLRVVVGGPHVSAAPQETMERYTSFDAVAVGEGEETILELLAASRSGASFDGIAGTVTRNGAVLTSNARRPFITDLDRLPFPAWDLLDGFPQRYSPPPFKVQRLPAASLVTSRGCPNRCIFCDRSVFGSACHGFSAGYVIRVIRELYDRHGVREFSFEDDTFVTFKPRLQEICAALIDDGPRISWSCLGRVNQVDPQQLALMRRAGCWQISFGIESGSETILKLIRKNVTLERIRTAVAAARDAGISPKGFFIVGHPGETRETLRQTIEFALELPLDDISVMMLTPFPGSEIYERAAEFGTFDSDWSRMNLLNPVFIPHGLTREDLETAQQELLKRFYFRSRIVARYAKRMLANPSVAFRTMRAAAAFVRSV